MCSRYVLDFSYEQLMYYISLVSFVASNKVTNSGSAPASLSQTCQCGQIRHQSFVYVHLYHVCVAELRSSGLASPVHSSLSRKSNTSSTGPAVGAIPRTSSMHDLLEHRVAVRIQSMPPSQSAGKTYRTG